MNMSLKLLNPPMRNTPTHLHRPCWKPWRSPCSLTPPPSPPTWRRSAGQTHPIPPASYVDQSASVICGPISVRHIWTNQRPSYVDQSASVIYGPISVRLSFTWTSGPIFKETLRNKLSLTWAWHAVPSMAPIILLFQYWTQGLTNASILKSLGARNLVGIGLHSLE